MHPICFPESVSHRHVVENCTASFVIELLDDSDKVGADIVFPHGSAACHTWSKVLFKCWLKQMGKLLLMLQVSLTDNPQVERMLCGCCPALKSTWNFPQFSFVLLSAFLDLIDLSIHIRFV